MKEKRFKLISIFFMVLLLGELCVPMSVLAMNDELPGNYHTVNNINVRENTNLISYPVSDSGNYILLDKSTGSITYCSPNTVLCDIPEKIQGIQVKGIGTEAFSFCDKLEKVIIPEGVTIIENNAFEYCRNLETVILPDSLTYIGESAFDGCSSIEYLYMDYVREIGKNAFRGCSDLKYVSNAGEIATINYGTFQNCSKLKTINLLKSVTNIEDCAFSGCESLVEIKFIENVTSIGWGAFLGCTSLEKIELPEGLTEIETGTFKNCTNLSSVTLPDAIKKISSYAFEGCSNLKTIKYNRSCLEWKNVEQYLTDHGMIVDMKHSGTSRVIEGKEASCTETGLTEGKICSACENIMEKQEVIEAKGHIEVIDQAIAPTSNQPGLTKGSHCSVCKEVLDEQIEIEALGTYNPFKDVDKTKFYYDPVLWAVKNNITTGKKPDMYCPEEPCTRAQVVTFLWRAIGQPEAFEKSDFEDLKKDAYYVDAVDWAVEEKITTGKGQNKFCPDEACTRAQIVTFLWRVAGCPKTSAKSDFEDLKEDAYYVDAINWAVEEGITTGKGPNEFGPDEMCTRAHIVTFLYRYMF